MTSTITREDVLALYERMQHPRSPQDLRLEIGGHWFATIHEAMEWLDGEGREILFRDRQRLELSGRPKVAK